MTTHDAISTHAPLSPMTGEAPFILPAAVSCVFEEGRTIVTHATGPFDVETTPSSDCLTINANAASAWNGFATETITLTGRPSRMITLADDLHFI